MKTIFTKSILTSTLIFMLQFSFSQTLQPYTPGTNSNSFYFTYDLQYINDGDLVNNGTIWNFPPNSFEMYMNFSTAVFLDQVNVKSGQFNGDYNVPAQMKLYRGTSSGTLLLTITPSYTNVVYNFSNSGSDTLYTWVITPNMSGYASLREITCFTNCTPTSSAINQTSCNNYVSPSGNYTWTSSGIYNDTIINAGGCDSILTLNVTINNANASATQNGTTITATATGAQYQWLNCPSMSPVPGATNQSYTASVNGNYAVIVTQNGCSDTSNCFSINSVNIYENMNEDQIILSPNPCSEYLFIESAFPVQRIEITDLRGRIVFQTYEVNEQIDLSKLRSGIYFVWMNYGSSAAVKKIIKN